MAKKDISIIIAAYNEEKNIGDTLERLLVFQKSYGGKCEIIVVDDGSNDLTAKIAKEKSITVIQHPYNKGYGASLKTGISAAKNNLIIIMDADGQHKDMQDIYKLLNRIDSCDMVVGARTADSYRPLLRRPGKWLLTFTANYLTKKKIPDLNSGFRCFYKDIVMPYFPLVSNEFSFTTTITMVMLTEGFIVEYVPIKVHKRTGKSTVRFFGDGSKTMLLLLRMIMLFNPLRVFLPLSIIIFILGAIRFTLGVITNEDYTMTAVIGILSSVFIFFFGLLVEQVAALRKDNVHIIYKIKNKM